MATTATEELRAKVVQAGTSALTGEAADPTGCGVAYEEYRRQAVFASLFTAAYFGLIAMTALVGMVSLALLVWVLVTLQSGETSDLVIRIIGTVGTAAGTVATGVAANQVKKASELQNQRATDANTVASTACGGPIV
jgi:hypothetical protein